MMHTLQRKSLKKADGGNVWLHEEQRRLCWLFVYNQLRFTVPSLLQKSSLVLLLIIFKPRLSPLAMFIALSTFCSYHKNNQKKMRILPIKC